MPQVRLNTRRAWPLASSRYLRLATRKLSILVATSETKYSFGRDSSNYLRIVTSETKYSWAGPVACRYLRIVTSKTKYSWGRPVADT